MELPTGRALTGDQRSRVDNLYAAYNLTSDNGPAESFAACFTPAGSLDLAFVGRRITSREDLTAYKSEDLTSRAMSGEVRRHVNGSLYTVVADDGLVHASCYYYLLTMRPSDSVEAGSVLIDAGRYDDVIDPEGEEYLFLRRTVTKDLRGTATSAPVA